jgi:hypothetical protein
MHPAAGPWTTAAVPAAETLPVTASVACLATAHAGRGGAARCRE